MSSASVHPIERVVLLGFMCSGKSSVGTSLARRLEWGFLDFDVEIETRERRPVAAIIDANGEGYFRDLETVLTREASQRTSLVLAPGGGWITRPEHLEILGSGTLSVWLDVSPVEAVRRLKDDSIARPLKEYDDAVGVVEAMLADRTPLYALADLRIPSDGRSVEEIAFELEQVVRANGGRSP